MFKLSNRSAAEWAKNDAELVADAAFKADFVKYSAPASKESLAKTVKALTDKKHTVKVVETEKEACDYLASLLKDGMSVSAAGSATLTQIGFLDYLKTREGSLTNYKSLAAAAAAAGNMGEHYALVVKGLGADIFYSSVSAVSEEGDIFACDASGTRVGGWFAAKQLVIVLGSNKIVPNEAAAEKRLYDYQFKLESARVRVAYKIPSSAVVNKVTLKSANPFAPNSTVVIVNKSLGF